jgi:hypothetical protein
VSQTVERYGKPFPADWPAWQIELACLAADHSPSEGGLGQHGHLKNAMIGLWPHLYFGEVEPGIPRWREEIELLTWAWAKYKFIAVIGHASAAKTHTFGHIAATQFLADAPNTIITLTSTHLSGLRKRLWSDTVSACLSSLAGPVFAPRHHDMIIRPEGSSEEKYVINGIATDRGLEAVEKIQGNHSRHHNFIIIDEAQGTPKAIFEAAANLSTDLDFRMAMLANPTKKFSELGSWCEPEGGWSKVDPEVDLFWETRRGGICVRLDGARSPNIKHGRTIFPFLIRQDYVDTIEKSFGRGSPRWWTFYRGWFAPDGAMGLVVPPSLLSRAEKKHEYNFKPTRIASLDPAFEGGDQSILSIAEYDDKFRLNLVAQLPVKVVVGEKSDPFEFLMAKEVTRLCKEHGVASASDLIVDTTGAGRGVAATIDMEWGKCVRCNFGAAASERKLKANDGENETSDKLFDRFVSELWWAVRVWLETGLVGGINTSDHKDLCDDLCAREYETVRDKLISVEKKKDMKERLGRSPDHGDSFCMLIELIRRRGAVAGADEKIAGGTPRDKQRERAIRYSRIANPEKEFTHDGSP